MEPRRALDSGQARTLADDGFCTLEAFVEDHELALMREVFDRLFATRTGWDEGNQFDLAGTDDGGAPRLPQILKPSAYAPELLDLTAMAAAREITRDYFQSDALLEMDEHMILKPPHGGSQTPWHQDQAYHDPTVNERSINFWIPLDDTDVANGCMQYVPGSNHNDVLPHHSIGNDPRVHGLEVDGAEAYAATGVPCPLMAGGCVLHLPTTLHYAGPNLTARPRRAYIMIMAVPGERRASPVNNTWMREKQTARSARARRAGS